MPKPKRGEVWLVRFPFTDLSSSKLRPALVLASHGEDVIVMGIFSRLPSLMRPTWVRIENDHPGFQGTGLKKSSILKAEKLAVVHESVFYKKLGILPAELFLQTEGALKSALLIS